MPLSPRQSCPVNLARSIFRASGQTLVGVATQNGTIGVAKAPAPRQPGTRSTAKPDRPEHRPAYGGKGGFRLCGAKTIDPGQLFPATCCGVRNACSQRPVGREAGGKAGPGIRRIDAIVIGPVVDHTAIFPGRCRIVGPGEPLEPVRRQRPDIGQTTTAPVAPEPAQFCVGPGPPGNQRPVRRQFQQRPLPNKVFGQPRPGGNQSSNQSSTQSGNQAHRPRCPPRAGDRNTPRHSDPASQLSGPRPHPLCAGPNADPFSPYRTGAPNASQPLAAR